jgi:S-adenosylhomocysteine hydrolase
MNYLEEQSSEKTQIHEYVTRYIINGKEIFVVRDGKNVNFIGESCPDNCMDLIHAGVLACTKKLLDTQADNKPGIIHSL